MSDEPLHLADRLALSLAEAARVLEVGETASAAHENREEHPADTQQAEPVDEEGPD